EKGNMKLRHTAAALALVICLSGCAAQPDGGQTQFEEFKATVDKLDHLAMRDVELHHACEDGKILYGQFHDDDKTMFCGLCRKGITHVTPPEYPSFSLDTCSACGPHEVILILSQDRRTTLCEMIPGVDAQKVET